MKSVNAFDQQTADAGKRWGLRPSTARECPRVVAGLQCRSFDENGLCICERHYRILDHSRIWLNKDGTRHILTAEPYNVCGEDLAGFLTDTKAFGLNVTFSGMSVWNPGHTLLIKVTRPALVPCALAEAKATRQVMND